MIDISNKPPVKRSALARGYIQLSKKTIDLIIYNKIKKGDPLEAAKIAAVLAVKKVPSIIMMCHNIPIESINVDFFIDDNSNRVYCQCEVTSTSKTGVEMEALTGVSVALLNIWDYCKYLEKDETGNYPNTKIGEIVVVKKIKSSSDNSQS